jgi:hypothetical protein
MQPQDKPPNVVDAFTGEDVEDGQKRTIEVEDVRLTIWHDAEHGLQIKVENLRPKRHFGLVKP